MMMMTKLRHRHLKAYSVYVAYIVWYIHNVIGSLVMNPNAHKQAIGNWMQILIILIAISSQNL